MSIRNLPIYLVILSFIGLSFGAGYISYPLLHGASEVGAQPASAILAQNHSDIQAMGSFWTAWDIMDSDFFGSKPDSTKRAYGAIKGMVESFNDPYTYFVEPQPRQLERDELAGAFGGIGANIELTTTGYVLFPQAGLPAAQV